MAIEDHNLGTQFKDSLVETLIKYAIENQRAFMGIEDRKLGTQLKDSLLRHLSSSAWRIAFVN